ncbi:MAG: SpoIIE family protein phosphatase, partial [Planctomycetota bacterium]|nr:SpoIIE family protein phosphatase [Planctomycetota bacterium]
LSTSIAILLNRAWLTDLEHQSEIVAQLKKFESSSGTDTVQNIVIRDTGAPPEVIAMFRPSFLATQGVPVESVAARRAGVEIEEFKADGVPVRSFTKTILGDPRLLLPPEDRERNPPDELAPGYPTAEVPVASVEVFLSARHIQDSRQNLSRVLTRISLYGCLVAAAGSYLLAFFLTRPIRGLVKDMKRVSQGDLEHQSSVDSSDELGNLARAFNVMTSNLRAGQEAKLARKAMEHELSLATSIQERLLPKDVPQLDGLDLAVFYLSAEEVGGDYYDFLPVDDSHLGLVVADVSGKGIPGSLVMTMTRSLLRMAAVGQVWPDAPVRQVNRCLVPDLNPGMFVTLLYLVLDTSTREVSLVRAGHNAPLLYSRHHSRVVQINSRGMAIGLDLHGGLFDSELEVKRFRLRPGDVFVAYTDGIIEAKDAAGRDFGEQRLSRLIASHHRQGAQEVVDAIIADVEAHEAGSERADDITLVVLKAT